MTDMIFFTHDGVRVPKVTVDHTIDGINGFIPGWVDKLVAQSYEFTLGWGFPDMREWVPRWLAIRMSRGWRVVTYPEKPLLSWIADDSDMWFTWWRSVAPDQKRLPHVAAVEMWVRMQAATQ